METLQCSDELPFSLASIHVPGAQGLLLGVLLLICLPAEDAWCKSALQSV